jgi:hypothetical protein
MLDIGTLFNIRMKYEISEQFFGLPVKYIYNFNVLELDEFLTNPTNFINIKFKKALEMWG